MNQPDIPLRLFRIAHGDSETATNWLLHLCDQLNSGKLPSKVDCECMATALFGVARRGDAVAFWNNGKLPDPRLKMPEEMEVFWRVRAIRREHKESKAVALQSAACELGYLNESVSDFEEDAVLNRVTQLHDAGQRKWKKFLKNQASSMAMAEALETYGPD